MNKNELRAAAKAARARAAGVPKPCGGCGMRFCSCHVEIEEHGDHLEPVDVKVIVIDCAHQLGLTNEAQVKLIAEACVLAGTITEAEVKEIVAQCVKTDAEIKNIVLTCLLEQGDSIDADGVKAIVEQCISTIVIPDAVSDAHIKAISLQCLLDQGAPISEADVNQIVDAAIDSLVIPEAVSEAYIKNIALQCIIDNRVTDDHIRCLFVEFLAEYEIAPDCIKRFVTDCVIELLPKPMTRDDVKCFIESCYGDQLHTDSQIKVLLLECISSQIGKQWTELEIKGLIETCVKTDAELKLFVQNCVTVPSTAEIQALAKAVAIQCIADNAPVQLTTNDIKAIFLDCFKDIEHQGVSDVDVDINCTDTLLSIDVEVDGVTGSGSVALSKFGNGNITPRTDAEIKVIAQDCINQLTLLTISDVSNYVQTLGHVDSAQAKVIAQNCINDISQLTLSDVINYINTLDHVDSTTAKTLAQQCLDDAANDQRFCVTLLTLNWDQQTGQLTSSIQDSCGTRSDSVVIETGVSADESKTIAQTCIDDNSERFCNSNVDVDFNSVTGELSISVADECGILSASAFIPVDPGGVDGITAAAAKAIAQQCINDSNLTPLTIAEVNALAKTVAQACIDSQNFDFVNPAESKLIAQTCVDNAVNDPRFCNSAVSTTLTNGVLTTSVVDNCGTVSDTVDLSVLSGNTGCCNQAIDLAINGQTLTATVNQSDGITVQDSVTLPTTAGSNVTALNGVFNPNTCAIDLTLSQTTGGNITTTVSIPPTAFTEAVVTDDDGCSEYKSLRFCGVEIFTAPVYRPKTDCKCITIPAGFSGPVTITLDQAGTTQSVDWGDGATSSGPSGTALSHTYIASATVRTLTLCNENPCDGINYTSTQTGLPEPISCGCCDC